MFRKNSRNLVSRTKINNEILIINFSIKNRYKDMTTYLIMQYPVTK